MNARYVEFFLSTLILYKKLKGVPHTERKWYQMKKRLWKGKKKARNDKFIGKGKISFILLKSLQDNSPFK